MPDYVQVPYFASAGVPQDLGAASAMDRRIADAHPELTYFCRKLFVADAPNESVSDAVRREWFADMEDWHFNAILVHVLDKGVRTRQPIRVYAGLDWGHDGIVMVPARLFR